MKVLLLGECESSNLGDQIIRDCLRYMFAEQAPGWTLETMDWRHPHGSRDEEAPVPGSRGKRGRRLLAGPRDRFLPLLIRLGLHPRHWSRVREEIERADYVLIGGGELLQETPCLFADRIAATARDALRAGTPFGFLACGVEPNCTRRSRRLMAPAFLQAGLITVRDDASLENLASWAPGVDLSQAVVGADPAVLVGRAYPIGVDEGREGFGVNVVAFESVSRRREVRVDSNRFSEWYLDLVRSVRRVLGGPVRLFTNGAPLDQRFAVELHGLLDDPDVKLEDRPRSVETFLRIVRGCRAVIAARLHTALTAASYGVPCVATAWSPKFDAFFRQMNRSERLFRLAESGPESIAEGMRLALSDTPRDGLDSECIASAFVHVKTLQALLT